MNRKILFSAAASAFVVAFVLWGGTHRTVQPRLKIVQEVVQSGPQTVQQVAVPSPQIVQQVVVPNSQAVRQVVQKKPQLGGEHKVAASIQPKPKKPVAQVLQAKSIAPMIQMIDMKKLLKEAASSDPLKAHRQSKVFEKTATDTETADGIGLDIGKGLPLPVPNSVLIAPNDKPEGFHVGVDYRLDQKWDVTGMAGVTTTGGIVTSPVKPSFNQVGVRANYRF